MFRGLTKHIILSQKAYTTICDSVTKVNNLYEIGGVLLGYKTLNFFYVSQATAQTNALEKSQVSFVLDGTWNTSKVKELSAKLLIKPSVVGIWHSHILDVEQFSSQDQESNLQLAQLYDGIVSGLITMTSPKHKINMAYYYISATGVESICKVSGLLRSY